MGSKLVSAVSITLAALQEDTFTLLPRGSGRPGRVVFTCAGAASVKQLSVGGRPMVEGGPVPTGAFENLDRAASGWDLDQDLGVAGVEALPLCTDDDPFEVTLVDTSNGSNACTVTVFWLP